MSARGDLVELQDGRWVEVLRATEPLKILWNEGGAWKKGTARDAEVVRQVGPGDVLWDGKYLARLEKITDTKAFMVRHWLDARPAHWAQRLEYVAARGVRKATPEELAAVLPPEVLKELETWRAQLTAAQPHNVRTRPSKPAGDIVAAMWEQGERRRAGNNPLWLLFTQVAGAVRYWRQKSPPDARR